MHYARWWRYGSTDERPRGKPAKRLGQCIECTALAVARERCPKHYRRLMFAQRPDGKVCRIDGCGRWVVTSDDLCNMHGRRQRTTGTTIYRRPSTIERFWSKVDKRGPDDCWPWLASLFHGHAQFRIDDRSATGHRYSYELVHGPLPPGMHLHHLCAMKHCVNPAHLTPLTPAAHAVETWINALRALGYAVTPPTA